MRQVTFSCTQEMEEAGVGERENDAHENSKQFPGVEIFFSIHCELGAAAGRLAGG